MGLCRWNHLRNHIRKWHSFLLMLKAGSQLMNQERDISSFWKRTFHLVTMSKTYFDSTIEVLFNIIKFSIFSRDVPRLP